VIVGEGRGRPEPYIFINPTINVIGTEQNTSEEGCLSVPGVFGNVTRASHIVVKAFDRHGQAWTKPADDMFARIIQHEIDHLNGVLFIDRTTDFTKGQEKLP
jgi:peptide deformylase